MNIVTVYPIHKFRVSCVGVTVAGILFLGYPTTAHELDRLQVTLVPVWVYVDEGEDSLIRAQDTALNESIVLMHQALNILGVKGDEYDLVVAPSDSHQTLLCTQTLAGGENPPQCIHPHDGPYGSLSELQILNLVYTMTGVWRNQFSDQGRVEYFVLLLPDNFTWGSTYYGVNQWWSWNGFDPEDLHWSTTSCQIWSNAWLYNIAHEMGHCFGLYHGTSDGSSDPNYDGADNSMDLMSIGAHFYVQNLRKSNKARVRHHFRVLDPSEPTNIEVNLGVRAVDSNEH